MGRLTIKEKVNVLIVGILVSVLFFFMIEVLFAFIIKNTVMGVLDNGIVLMLIILGLELLIFPIGIVVGIMMTQKTKLKSVLKASLMAFICNLLFLIFISYISLFIAYPEVFSEVSGVEIILIVPQVLVYFGIYILNNVILLFIFSVVSYFIFYIIFLDVFHEYKNYKTQKNYNSW
ncbi:MAG: hypothetical protein ACTSSB_11340 [Candidatus Heimdallarchaeota archaeon]